MNPFSCVCIHRCIIDNVSIFIYFTAFRRPNRINPKDTLRPFVIRTSDINIHFYRYCSSHSQVRRKTYRRLVITISPTRLLLACRHRSSIDYGLFRIFRTYHFFRCNHNVLIIKRFCGFEVSRHDKYCITSFGYVNRCKSGIHTQNVKISYHCIKRNMNPFSCVCIHRCIIDNVSIFIYFTAFRRPNRINPKDTLRPFVIRTSDINIHFYRYCSSHSQVRRKTYRRLIITIRARCLLFTSRHCRSVYL